MDILYPLAQSGDLVLIINFQNINYIGKERALEVMAIQINLTKKQIFDILELEKYLKFGYWNEIIDKEEREKILKMIKENFSEEEVQQKILQPLQNNKIE